MNERTPFAGCLRPLKGRASAGAAILVGLPDDSRSSYRKGAAGGPQAVRRCYNGDCYNSATESGVDLAGQVFDGGDWPPKADWDRSRRHYRESAQALFADGAVPFFLGGDHAVTVPLVEALCVLSGPVHVVQFDAHPDLYNEFLGDRFSHACTGRRMLEMDHLACLTQMGVRTLNPEQLSQGEPFGERLRILTAAGLEGRLPYPGWIPPDAWVYVTLDIDVLDPAYAPGVAHPVPGGLASRQLLDWIQGFPWRLAGMDVVEVNPELDLNGQTAVLAGRLLHEAMALASGVSRQAAKNAKTRESFLF